MNVSDSEIQKRNKTSEKDYNMFSNDLNSNSGTFSSNYLVQYKSNQNELSIGSSNCVLPQINSDGIFGNDINIDPVDTFITDKIKNNRLKEEHNYEAFTNPNILKPYYLNKLCIDIEEQQLNNPKSINPLFFLINGWKKINKEKYRNIPVNYKTVSSFNLKNSDDDYMEYIQKQFDQLQQKKFINSFHESVKTTTFLNCFNKCMKDKLKTKTDWKKVIFNNPKDKYETKVNLIKDIIKTEMTNRSIGKGIFNTHIKFKNRRMSNWKEYVNEKKKENRENCLSIDLQKKECFGKKPLNKAAEVFFNRNFLRLTFDSYKQQKEEKEIEKKRTKEINLDFKKMYIKRKESKNNSNPVMKNKIC